MGGGPSLDVVIGTHGVHHEEIVGILVHEEGSKCSSETKPWLRVRRASDW